MIELSFETFGTQEPPLVIAHGLFGSARNWRVIAKRLSSHRRVIAVDMRNHGDSPHDPDHSYSAMADDLARVIDKLGGRADLLGHSMGGKAAMVLALTHPEILNRLIIADIAPVTYQHSQSVSIEAMRRVPLLQISRRSEADPFLAETIDDAAQRAFLLQSLVLDTNQGNRWKLNLDALRVHLPDVIGFPEVAGTFSGPTLFLNGANSDYVRPDHKSRIMSLFPSARMTEIEKAGHWLHAEQPKAFVAAVDAFLQN